MANLILHVIQQFYLYVINLELDILVNWGMNWMMKNLRMCLDRNIAFE